MKTYRHLGKEAMITGANPEQLKRYGQSFQMPEEMEVTCLHASVAFLPDADFNKLGFTAPELSKHFTPAMFSNAPADFKAKHEAALAAYFAFRESVLNPSAPAEVAEQKDGEV
jgi:hypothetical protein